MIQAGVRLYMKYTLQSNVLSPDLGKIKSNLLYSVQCVF